MVLGVKHEESFLLSGGQRFPRQRVQQDKGSANDRYAGRQLCFSPFHYAVASFVFDIFCRSS